MECRKCKYVTEHNGAFFCMGQKNMPYVTGDGVCERWKPSYITNADRIRAMTDEELAEFLDLVRGNKTYPIYYTDLIEWLKQEANE